MLKSAVERAAKHPDVQRFARFAVIGGISTLVQFAILVALVELAHLAKPGANAAGYVISALFNYSLNRAFAFSGTQRAFGAGLWRFALASLAGLALNTLIFIALMQAGLGYLWAWVAATGTVLLCNYAAARHFVFRHTV